jgi:hypothetical protein
MSPGIELTTYYGATGLTPATSLTYRARLESGAVDEAIVRVGDQTRLTKAAADIFELIFRYPQKCVDRAVVAIGGAIYDDADGDGYIGSESVWQILSRESGNVPGIRSRSGPQYIYELITRLSGQEALSRSFTATCGSTAADVHSMRGHNVLWASVPPGRAPNEVHRHLGGSVYCLFYRGRGRFHRVDPKGEFETLDIQITETNSFQMLAIPTHLWYQPINTGDANLEYFMIHEPAFDASELLVLDRDECRKEWQFEF